MRWGERAMTAWKPMNQTSFAFAHDRSRRGRRSRMDNTGNRLFFGLCPPPAIERQVASIADDYKNAFSLSGQLRLTTLHVTIRWVCDYPNLPEHVIFAALQAGVGAEPADHHHLRPDYEISAGAGAGTRW